MNQYFNANHSPIGAYASFTLGYPGPGGGPSYASEGPARTNVYIGAQRQDLAGYQALPFFVHSGDESKRYDVEKATPDADGYFEPYAGGHVSRAFSACVDQWRADDLRFTLYSPARPVPDPAVAEDEALRGALLPAVLAELELDNRRCDTERLAFFGMDRCGTAFAARRFDAPFGVGWGGTFAAFAQEGEAAAHFCPECVFGEKYTDNWDFNLGKTVMLLFRVPPREKKTFKIALCFYQAGTATYGLETRLYYTRLWDSIEAVGRYALERFDRLRDAALADDRRLDDPSLTDDQRFMLCHAVRSYYNSTQLLDRDGAPIWLVNEGEFRMMNTLDLTVDQLFYELKMNPWTVRSELELYYERYAYRDKTAFPGDAREYPGGIAFCHDMGVGNQFSPPGHSCYERAGLTGCFSFMSCEELVNWLICALAYLQATQDAAWEAAYAPVLEECFSSLLNRDHPDPALRDGLMSLDSSRTRGGAEITTYDSLDPSLGQARNNLYLGGKCWAVYLGLAKRFALEGKDELAASAREQARRGARTIAAALNERGYIPAILGENNDSCIIPAIEGLVYPRYLGCEDALADFPEYLAALQTHLRTVLRPGVCLFEDGGWKLSSTSDNSWLSKIYLCEYAARELLGLPKERTDAADRAHVAWLTHPELSVWCWSDQIVAGSISASKYYPRGVTSILWLTERKKNHESL